MCGIAGIVAADRLQDDERLPDLTGLQMRLPARTHQSEAAGA
jgi:hypothetical protein